MKGLRVWISIFKQGNQCFGSVGYFYSSSKSVIGSAPTFCYNFRHFTFWHSDEKSQCLQRAAATCKALVQI